MRLDDIDFCVVDDIVDWRNSVRSSLRTSGITTVDSQIRFWKSLRNNQSIKYFAIMEDKEDPKEGDPPYDILGIGGLVNIEWANGIGEIAILLNPKFKNKGLGKEVVDLLLEEGFDNMGLRTIYGECYACSPALQFWQKLAKARDWYTTVLPRRKLWYGRLHDSFYFSIEAEKIKHARLVLKAGD